MKTYLLPSIKITLLTMVFFGMVYPLIITGIATLSAPNGGQGAILYRRGKPAGFELIGQSFVSDKYFNGRPSAVDYNASSAGGSNKGSTNPEYLRQVEDRIALLLNQNPGVQRKDIPVDLVTASGSGLDPDISPRAAEIQISRIAKARGIDEMKLRQLVNDHIERPFLNLLGPPKVHVLKLNIALDDLSPSAE